MKYGIDRIENRTEDGDYDLVRLVEMPREEAVKLLSSSEARREFFKTMVDGGYLAGEGCDCSHCRSGRDCCGEDIGTYPSLVGAPGGVLVTQHFFRNI